MTTEALTYIAPPLAARHELTIEDVLAQAEKILQAMRQAMEPGIHYGRIPGTPKPTLLKGGAEKLCLLFRLDPQYASTKTYDGDHLTVESVCTLWHIPTGQRFGSGEGSCSTREKKYAYRSRGGERIPNPDLPDQWNTVLKMANKRALVAAVLNVTAASDVFTQDLEDLEPGEKPAPPPAPEKRADPVNREPEPGARDFEEYKRAFQRFQTTEDDPQALDALWRGVRQPDIWKGFTVPQQVELGGENNAAKKRIGAR